ncbi:potassium intermediate small conductance calcium-activated channel, sub N, member 3, partial [Clonorchis sinensis]
IFLCEEYIKDWRISVTRRRVLQVTLELLICSIHPLPGVNLFFELPSRPPQNITVPLHPIRKEVGNSNLMGKFSPYLLLVLPMIGRLYLAFRTLLLHSKMFNDAGSRSIGSMNKVSFDLRFVLKTMMTLCPLKSLLVFICVIWIILSWMLRACELRIQMESQLSPLNSAWLISVTFLSIGYGDIVPHTHCGRLVAVITGLMGSACTALLVAVFSRKLELSKAEKHVLHFMEANEITKRTWLLYKNARLMPTVNPKRVRVHQRRFLQAIYSLRKIKVKQREMQDKSDSLVDLAKLQTNVFEGVADISLRQDSFQSQLKCIEHQLLEIKRLIVEEHRTEKPCSSQHLVNAATGSRDHRRLSADHQLRTIFHDSS